MESLGKNARSLLLQGKRNINVSNLQNYFRIQNVGNLLGGCLTCEELVGGTWNVSDCEELVGVNHTTECVTDLERINEY